MRVPQNDNAGAPPQAAEIDESTWAMAAAMMQQEGLFDPTPMTPPKSPNQRVREGHQEFEQGYIRGWDTGDRSTIMNTRGQTLEARKI